MIVRACVRVRLCLLPPSSRRVEPEEEGRAKRSTAQHRAGGRRPPEEKKTEEREGRGAEIAGSAGQGGEVEERERRRRSVSQRGGMEGGEGGEKGIVLSKRAERMGKGDAWGDGLTRRAGWLWCCESLEVEPRWRRRRRAADIGGRALGQSGRSTLEARADVGRRGPEAGSVGPGRAGKHGQDWAACAFARARG